MAVASHEHEPSETELRARLRRLQARNQELEVRVKALEAENTTLLGRIQKLVVELATVTNRDRQQELSLEIRRLQHQLAARNREIFGTTRSERRPPAESADPAGDKAGDGEGAESNDGEAAPRPEKQRKKRTDFGRTAQPSLPVVEVVHELDEADQICPKCVPGQLLPMKGQFEASEQITIERVRFKLQVDKRQKYHCDKCDHIDTALGPPRLKPGCRYSPEFAVQVAVDKYRTGSPSSGRSSACSARDCR